MVSTLQHAEVPLSFLAMCTLHVSEVHIGCTLHHLKVLLRCTLYHSEVLLSYVLGDVYPHRSEVPLSFVAMCTLPAPSELHLGYALGNPARFRGTPR